MGQVVSPYRLSRRWLWLWEYSRQLRSLTVIILDDIFLNAAIGVSKVFYVDPHRCILRSSPTSLGITINLSILLPFLIWPLLPHHKNSGLTA